ncbi:hypothetical protein METBIDRAFT_34459 [Metschnikowia bicuspidata var. bicuspidata NRRL YB-4993]|uniref:RING-type domain-containing protein n=1 Tax=Metschnikowia bicuspidata var. bicuspidata NRRL YB-4993 TaxID=869754 RepID=A0A1A0HJC1_9ASCO|nr:hypothetical protein METBIDRAFT_34459 [Metschnikowia bicuspidata var. bicuspidata NRRL YB-4993]OBA24096.1 hypothetical protein METBIDRAFT_34459 [Metschnikowia bicuspidata var. bicuspidata NRRL YB-4993]
MSVLFAERLHRYLQNPENPDHLEEGRDPPNERSQEPEDAHPPLPASPTSLNIFDEILDTVLGRRSTEENLHSSAADQRPLPAAGQNEPTGLDASGNTTNVEGTTVFTTGSPGGHPGAIVITVNYMFMDSAEEPTPGRTGSLVVTIPNNATNREPHIISLFISLATRMAYSALINNAPKPKPGIPLEKFQSFKSLNVEDLADKTCAICFEQYECSPPINVEDHVITKKRKLSSTMHVPSASATPEPSPSLSAQIERENPPSADSNNTPQNETADENPNDEQGEQKVYLCEHEEEFDHTPLQMPCNHVFGRSCLAHWLKENTNCPLCRLSVADPDQAPARSTGIPPISYIRFGGLDDLTTEPLNPPSTASQPNGDSAILRRATLVIFNQSARRARDSPAASLEASGGTRSLRERNPPFSPVINNIQNYFRRARRRRDDLSGSNSLFASGVSSRRTPSGVETVASDSDSLQGRFRNSSMFASDFGSSARSSRETRLQSASTNEQAQSSSAQGQQNGNQDGTQEQADPPANDGSA